MAESSRIVILKFTHSFSQLRNTITRSEHEQHAH